jgi:hypothetical protein
MNFSPKTCCALPSPPLHERIVIKILFVHREAGSDVVSNRLQPAELVGRERRSCVLLLAQPCRKPRLYFRSARSQFALLLESEAHQVDQVCRYFCLAAAHM